MSFENNLNNIEDKEKPINDTEAKTAKTMETVEGPNKATEAAENALAKLSNKKSGFELGIESLSDEGKIHAIKNMIGPHRRIQLSASGKTMLSYVDLNTKTPQQITKFAEGIKATRDVENIKINLQELPKDSKQMKKILEACSESGKTIQIINANFLEGSIPETFDTIADNAPSNLNIKMEGSIINSPTIALQASDTEYATDKDIKRANFLERVNIH